MEEEKKKLTAEQRFNEGFISEVIDAVKTNQAPWQKSWQSGEILSPYNAQSGNLYSGRNAVRLALKAQQNGYEDPRWATAYQINEMQGRIKKGEHGTGILFFKQQTVLNQETGEEETRKIIKYSTVFNIEQTNLPTITRAEARETTPDIEAFAQLLEHHQPLLARGEPAYRPSNDTIYMPDKGNFKDDASYYSTFLHEMAHWTGHESRLNRDLNNRFGTPAYAREELVAELSSYMLALEHGLPFEPNQSEAYLQHWAEKTGQEIEEALQLGFKEAVSAKSYIDTPLREKNRNKDRAVEQEQITSISTEQTNEQLNQPSYSHDNPYVNRHSHMPVAGLENNANLWEERIISTEATLAELSDKAEEQGFIPSLIEESYKQIAVGKFFAEKTWSDDFYDLDDYFYVHIDGLFKNHGSYDAIYSPHDFSVKLYKNGKERERFFTNDFDQALQQGNTWLLQKEEEYRHEIEAAEIEQAEPVQEEIPQQPALESSIQTTQNEIATKTEHDSERITAQFWQDFYAEVNETAIIDKRMEGQKLYLAVSWDDRHEAKKLGAVWDNTTKCWYSEQIDTHPQLEKYRISMTDAIGETQSGKTIDDLKLLMNSLGLQAQNFSTETGKWHRVPLVGRGASNKDGAYKIFQNPDGTLGAVVKNLATGNDATWSNRGKSERKIPVEVMRSNELNSEIRQRITLQVRQETQHQRGRVALALYNRLETAHGDEPYLGRKQMQFTHGLKRLDDGSIVVPLINGEALGAYKGIKKEERYFGLVSLQVITPDGDKRLMRQAPKQGSYFPIGSHAARAEPTHIILAEGVASAEAAYQLFDSNNRRVLAIAAIDSGNLHHVAKTLSEMYPQAEKIIAVDNDIATEKKTGKNTGIAAAKAVQMYYSDFKLAIPEAIDGKNTDWNDVLVIKGKTAAQAEFAQQLGFESKKPEQHHLSLPELDNKPPREIGKVAYEAIAGDISKLPQLQEALAEKGYQLDERRLSAIKHPVELKDAFTKAISQTPQQSKRSQKEAIK